MRTGRVTQTIWNRFVKKQINKGNEKITGKIAWEENCSELESEQSSFFWSSASVNGNAPTEVRYAVLKAAGDLAAKKICPSAVSVQILFPETAKEQELKELVKNLKETCKELQLEITGIHAESADHILRTTVNATVVGRRKNLEGNSFETELHQERKSDQQTWNPGTEIIFCGYIGLEGTLRLIEEAEEKLRTRFTPSFLEKAKRCQDTLVFPEQILQISDEAKSRQCGDGGVLCGLWELAEAEKIGFEIDFSKIPLKQETVEICEFLQLNPYLLTSAGSYLILTEHGEEVIEDLKKTGVAAVRIGVVKNQNARVLVNGEETRYLDRPAPDELSRWWKEEKLC